MEHFSVKAVVTAAIAVLFFSDLVSAKTCSGVRCPADNQCATYECRRGQCTWVPKSGIPCNDNNLCTVEDTCKLGRCVGKPKCTKPKGSCLASKCDKATGLCSEAMAKDGTRCDDGKKCTAGDKCVKGVCEGTAVTCPSGPCLLTNQCVEASGGCVATLAADGAVCDDGRDCTWNTKCRAGNCVGDRIVCNALPTQCKRNKCNPLTGKCDVVNSANGTPCNDGKKCTVKDQCQDGVCVGTARTCTALPCSPAQCNEATGRCEPVGPALADGTTCDDGKKCTIGDVCKSGLCVGTHIACDKSNTCVTTKCNPLTGVCESKNKADKSPCEDGLKCTVGDFCVSGKCQPGKPKRCPKDTLCATFKCTEPNGACEKTLAVDGTTCDDGGKCTTGDACKAGKCVPGPAKCPPGNDPCVRNICNPKDGSCTIKKLANGAKCDDGLGCTVGDTCRNGKCKGTPKICSPTRSPCNKNVCVEPGKCIKQFDNGRTCSNRDSCTVNDVCTNGRCLGTPKCVDKDATDCLTLSCVNGSCKQALEPSGRSCKDASGAAGTCNTVGTCIVVPPSP